MQRTKLHTRIMFLLLIAALALVLGLTGCGSDDEQDDDAGAAANTTETTDDSADAGADADADTAADTEADADADLPAITVDDPWVRATIAIDADAEADDMSADDAADDESADDDAMDTDDAMDDAMDAEDVEMADEDADMIAEHSGPVTGAFMIIHNNGAESEYLVSASVDPSLTGTVELHETTFDENDVMQMRPVTEIEVPAGGNTVLKPGAYHIMLIDMQQQLNSGDTVTLTLTFKSGLTLDVEAPVRAMGS